MKKSGIEQIKVNTFDHLEVEVIAQVIEFRRYLSLYFRNFIILKN